MFITTQNHLCDGDKNLAILRQRPLKPSTIWMVEATISAPCVARIIFLNLYKVMCRSEYIFTKTILTVNELKFRFTYKTALGSKPHTDIGSGSSHLPERIIEIVGATKVYEPPITTGNLVPNHVCNRVFNPATNSNVWITFAFSSWRERGREAKRCKV